MCCTERASVGPMPAKFFPACLSEYFPVYLLLTLYLLALWSVGTAQPEGRGSGMLRSFKFYPWSPCADTNPFLCEASSLTTTLWLVCPLPWAATSAWGAKSQTVILRAVFECHFHQKVPKDHTLHQGSVLETLRTWFWAWTVVPEPTLKSPHYLYFQSTQNKHPSALCHLAGVFKAFSWEMQILTTSLISRQNREIITPLTGAVNLWWCIPHLNKPSIHQAAK